MLFVYKALDSIEDVYIYHQKNDTSAIYEIYFPLHGKSTHQYVAFLLARILNTVENKSLQATGFKVICFCLRPQHPVYPSVQLHLPWTPQLTPHCPVDTPSHLSVISQSGLCLSQTDIHLLFHPHCITYRSETFPRH